MQTSDVTALSDDLEAVKQEWLGRLEALVTDVKGWAEQQKWRTRRALKTIREQPLGAYKAPFLLMEKDTVEVVLNPVARYMPDATGAVDFYVAPAYDDIASFYCYNDQWNVHYWEPNGSNGSSTSRETQVFPLREETILMIRTKMLENA